MTGFSALYYTDCRPGQGLLGGAGFQFQASSPGVPPEAAGLVQRAGLYEPPVAWMRSRRPVADYPPSLTHAADGELYMTAAGCYLGVEANGTREGNQFTHALVTVQPESYGLVRPAQLWGAPWWATGAAPTTALDAVDAEPQRGPLSTERVRDRILAVPDARAWLTALLSALHRLGGPDRRPVLMVSEDPEEVACWVAAATLLMPLADALRVGFKIFAADVQHSRHDVVALHPEWAGPWSSTAGESGFAVFDLVQRRFTPLSATEAAEFWVPRFLRDDPYDVVDAVEHAGRFTAARGGHGAGQEAAGDRLAAAVTALNEPVGTVAEARAMADWLAGAPQNIVGTATDRVVAAVLAAAPTDAETLRHLLTVVARRGPQEVIDRTRAGLLRAEAAQVLSAPGQAGVDLVDGLPLLRTAPDHPDGAKERLQMIEQALVQARPDQVAGLLTLATRHRLRPRQGNIADSARRFASWWLDQPTRVGYRADWTIASDVLDWVRDALSTRLAGGRARSTEDDIDLYWWPLLWPATNTYPAVELDACVCGRAYEHASAEERPELLREVLRRSRTDSGPEPGSVTWDAVFRYVDPARSLEGVVGLLTELRTQGLPLGRRLAEAVAAALVDSGPPSRVGFRVLDLLTEAGHVAPTTLSGWHGQRRTLLEVIDTLTGPREPRIPAEVGKRLSLVSPVVLEIRADDVLSALLGCAAQVALEVLAACDPPHQKVLLHALQGRWPRLGDVPATVEESRAVALAYLVVEKPKRGLDHEAAMIKRPLGVIARGLPRKGRNVVDQAYGRKLGSPWWSWLKENDHPERSSGQPSTDSLGGGLRSLLPKRRG